MVFLPIFLFQYFASALLASLALFLVLAIVLKCNDNQWKSINLREHNYVLLFFWVKEETVITSRGEERFHTALRDLE
jgi:hypothetical protein